MLRFYYDPKYKYTNRTIIDPTNNNSYRDIDYVNIDSPDTINGHIIYSLTPAESVPTYIVDQETNRKYFVSGITQLRTGKFQLSLLRDMISENVSVWNSQEAYIEAGTATDYNKYKRWDLPYTNTKISQERLNINGKSSFFVFYVNKQNFTNDGVITEDNLRLQYATLPELNQDFDYQVSNLNEIPNYNYIGQKVGKYTNITYSIKLGFIENYLIPRFRLVNFTKTTAEPVMEYSGTGISTTVVDDTYFYTNCWDYVTSDNQNNMMYDIFNTTNSYVNDYINNIDSSMFNITDTAISALQPYVGKTIYNNSDGKVYRLNLSIMNNPIQGTPNTNSLTQILNNTVDWFFADTFSSTSVANNAPYLNVTATQILYNYTLEEIGTATSFDLNLIANQRKLPKSSVRCVNIVANETITDEELSQALMLAQTNPQNTDDTTGRIIDIQYLPFQIATQVNENIKISGQSMTAQFLDLDDFIFETNLPDLTNINKETDTIKIVSPSRASQYLFRPYDNNGNMQFNTKITLKPFTTVIYIRPSTQGLLINDWDDKDCLIIAEDFSLTTVTSQWTEYIYNNRNWQNAFERNIQGREFERSWERQIEEQMKKSDAWNARNLSAQKASTYTGNLPIISGIAGAIGTAWKDSAYMQAAELDRQYNEAMYQEGISLAREQFSYQIDNIQSQPLVPSKITTIDCKLLDGIYLEFYSTNPTELTAINNYYKYNGNRIDSYGQFQTYWGNFVRGKIIKSNNYTQPELNELNRRLSMGIYTEVYE